MSPWLIVFIKEFRDFVCDKRVRSSAFVMPIVLVVVLVYLFGSFQSVLTKPASQTIYILSQSQPSTFQTRMADALKSSGINVKSIASLDDAKKQIESGDIKVLLQFGTGDKLPIQVTEYYDPGNQASQITIGVLEQAFQKAGSEELKILLKAHSIDPVMAEPIKVTQVTVHKGEKSAGEFILDLLPYLVVLWAFYGGMGAVGDLVAGEKEKFTLETLLTTPVPRSAIALGKLAALSALCLAGALSAVVGILITVLIPLQGFHAVVGSGVGLTPVSVLIFIAVLIPTALMFASIMTAISARARNNREAMTQLAVMSTVIIIPAIGSQFIGYTDFGRSWMVSLVPVLNSANTLRLALAGAIPLLAIAVTAAINLAIAGVFSAWLFQIFRKESVLDRI